MASVVYLLCTFASVFCAGLLLRSYVKQRTRLLMWCTLGFVGLAINNILLFIDLVLVTDVDLSLLRTGTAAGAILVMVIGLVWEGT